MRKLIKLLFILLTIVIMVNSRSINEKLIEQTIKVKNVTSMEDDLMPSPNKLEQNEESKQLFVGASGKETNTPDFVRLVVMRLVYGLASRMGLEERLENAFNGVFVPPNADEGLFGDFGDGGGGDDDLFGGIGDLLDY